MGKHSGPFQVLDVILARRLGATFASTLTLFLLMPPMRSQAYQQCSGKSQSADDTAKASTTQENHVNSSEFSSLRGSGRIKRRHTAAQWAWNSIGLFTSSSIGLAHSGSSQEKRRTNRGAKSKGRLWRCACISFLRKYCIHTLNQSYCSQKITMRPFKWNRFITFSTWICSFSCCIVQQHRFNSFEIWLHN